MQEELWGKRIECLLEGCEHKILSQYCRPLCGQTGGAHVWKEALFAMLKAGTWPKSTLGLKSMNWSCNDCLYVWKGLMEGEAGCCQTSPHDSIMYHLEEIAKKLTDTPNNLEHQKPIQVLSVMELTSIILSPTVGQIMGL